MLLSIDKKRIELDAPDETDLADVFAKAHHTPTVKMSHICWSLSGVFSGEGKEISAVAIIKIDSGCPPKNASIGTNPSSLVKRDILWVASTPRPRDVLHLQTKQSYRRLYLMGIFLPGAALEDVPPHLEQVIMPITNLNTAIKDQSKNLEGRVSIVNALPKKWWPRNAVRKEGKMGFIPHLSFCTIPEDIRARMIARWAPNLSA